MLQTANPFSAPRRWTESTDKQTTDGGHLKHDIQNEDMSADINKENA